MVRGRRKDPTITPSRALMAQREYRARKSQKENDIFVRLQRAEEENTLLRKELELLRSLINNASGNMEMVSVITYTYTLNGVY
jgi:hypothetical protein